MRRESDRDLERVGGTNHNHDCSGTTITHREGEGAAAATVTASKPPLHRRHVVRSPEPNSGVAFAGLPSMMFAKKIHVPGFRVK